MRSVDKQVEPILWTIDSTGRLWQVNTNNCTALPSIKLEALPSSSQKSVLDSVWQTWTRPVISRRFCRAKLSSKLGRFGKVGEQNNPRMLSGETSFFSRHSAPYFGVLSARCFVPL